MVSKMLSEIKGLSTEKDLCKQGVREGAIYLKKN